MSLVGVTAKTFAARAAIGGSIVLFMFQFSIYLRHCSSRENMQVHQQRVMNMLPSKGHVGMLSITDAQFERMKIWYNAEEQEEREVPQQLELF